jgi:hypothetical protein
MLLLSRRVVGYITTTKPAGMPTVTMRGIGVRHGLGAASYPRQFGDVPLAGGGQAPLPASPPARPSRVP